MPAKRILRWMGVLDRHNRKPSQKGKGFNQPADKLHGRQAEIFAARDAELQEARQRRAANRNRAKAVKKCYTELAWPEDRATVGTDPSAAPGLEAEGGVDRNSAPSSPFCFEPKAINPRGSGGLVPHSKQHGL